MHKNLIKFVLLVVLHYSQMQWSESKDLSKNLKSIQVHVTE